MLKTILFVLLPILSLFSNGSDNFLIEPVQNNRQDTGTLEKMIASSGSVAMDLNLSRLNGRSGAKQPKSTILRFDVENNSFFTILVFNDELRGTLPSSMGLVPKDAANLPARLNASFQQLVVQNESWGGEYDLTVRDGKSGFVFFNIEGQQLDYNPAVKTLNVPEARLLLSKEFANELGRPSEAGTVVGQISINASMHSIEITKFENGEVQSEEMPPVDNAGSVPGPDVVVGDLSGLAQFGGSSGTQVGLAVGTDSCNFGVENLHWFANPANDHPVIPQNLYRMSGGTTNDERFEQIGQSSVKHAFTALTNNICGLGCNGVGGSNLGSGCSDPYGASLNAGPSLGSRAWINPFNGAYPRNDSATPNNSHTGHTHTGPSHRILTEMADLNTSLNPGASYYAEAQYITPHEYAWCSTHPTECNMYNNVSYRKYNVSGTASPFGFSAAAATVRTKAAIVAWTGATLAEIRPDPGNDGIGFIGYKVTQTSTGVWHYEYAVYNQNLDRGIQSFSVPTGSGASLNNIGFHAPPQHPGWTGDGTTGNGGFASTPWTGVQTGSAVTWGSETLTQNPNANAIRWGTLYNFRFDSNRPPQTVNATIGFYKTGAPIQIQVQGPSPAAASNVSVAGRVTRADGTTPILMAMVFITDSNNVTRMALTNPFGYYNFDNVLTGATYTVSVLKKGYSFNPQVIQPSENISNLDFTALP
jgi:hypothetical protein